MYAHDAYGSVTLLALLLFLWGAISLVTLHTSVFDLPNELQVVVGGSATLYFLGTRHRPSTRVALAFSVLVIAYSLILLPWTAVVWTALGRPLEAFTVPEVGMVITALVIPRFVSLGAVTLGLFAAESLFAYFHARQIVPEKLIPITEPGATLGFALLGAGLLVLRERRRQLALRHIRVQSEAAALRGIGPLFSAVRADLETELALLADERTRLGAGGSSSRIDRAVDRLVAVSRKLDNLIEGRPDLGRPAAVDRSLLDETKPVASEAEGLLMARAAYSGAIAIAGVAAAWELLRFLTLRSHQLDRESLVMTGTISVCLSCLIYLVSTRRRPSARTARWLVLVIMGLVLTVGSIDQTQYLRMGRPYSPFLAHKMVMVILGLMTTRRSWPGIVLIIITAGIALAIYFDQHLGAHRDLISLAEPWVTLVFMAIGIAGAAMREQRILASLRLLRAEATLSTLHRRALIFLALRDQLNSPLQTLLLWADQLEGQRSRQELGRVHAGIERLIGRSRELAELDQLIPARARSGALDAERELQRRGTPTG